MGEHAVIWKEKLDGTFIGTIATVDVGIKNLGTLLSKQFLTTESTAELFKELENNKNKRYIKGLYVLGKHTDGYTITPTQLKNKHENFSKLAKSGTIVVKRVGEESSYLKENHLINVVKNKNNSSINYLQTKSGTWCLVMTIASEDEASKIVISFSVFNKLKKAGFITSEGYVHPKHYKQVLKRIGQKSVIQKSAKRY